MTMRSFYVLCLFAALLASNAAAQSANHPTRSLDDDLHALLPERGWAEVSSGQDVLSAIWTQAWRSDAWADSARQLVSHTPTTIERIDQRRENEDWLNISRSTLISDGAGNLIEVRRDAWNGSDWIEAERFLYTYDGASQLREYLQQMWDGSSWIATSRRRYSYDASGVLTHYVNETHDGGSWELQDRAMFTYENQNRLTAFEQQLWSGTDGTPVHRILVSYNAKEQRSEDRFQAWSGSVWTDQTRQLYAYNDDTLTERLVEVWTGTDWLPSERTSDTFDAEGDRSLRLIQRWTGSAWTNHIQQFYLYNGVVATEPIRPGSEAFLALAPNPVSHAAQLRVYLPDNGPVSLLVFDVRGRLVLSVLDDVMPAGTAILPVDTAQLPAGTYLLVLRTTEGTQSLPFTVIR